MNAWRPALLYTRNQKCLSVICRREFLRRPRPTEQMLQSIFILALLLLFSCHIFLWILNLCDQQQCSSCRHFQNCGYFHRINVGCQRCIKANVTCHCCAHRFRSRPWLMANDFIFVFFKLVQNAIVFWTTMTSAYYLYPQLRMKWFFGHACSGLFV